MKATRQRITVDSIMGGLQKLKYLAASDEFLFSLGIDPEESYGSQTWPMGAISPLGMTRPDGITDYIKAAPMFISGASESAGVWVTGADGSLYSFGLYTFAANMVGIGNPGGIGNGMVIYNDYVYQATGTDIYRHGRISQSAPSFAQYWTTSLSMSALTDSTYPTTRNVYYPNHFLHKHNDGYVYVLDYDGVRGRVHRFITDYDGANGAAQWSVLSLPPKMMPFSMASYGTDLAIVCSPDARYASGTIPRVGDAVVYLWDTTQGTNFYRAIPLGEQMATAAAILDGDLFVFAGMIDGGTRLLQYLGGTSMREVITLSDGSPPFAGAVDVMGDAILWGQSFSYPSAMAGLMKSGYMRGGGRNKVHGMVRISDTTSTLPVVTAVKMLARNLYPALGWRTDSPAQYGLGMASQSNMGSVFITSPKVVGRKFCVRRLTLTLSQAVSAGTTITPTVYTDNFTNTYTSGSAGLAEINATNFPASEKVIDFRDLSCSGETDFVLRLDFTGTATDAVILPIAFEIETYD